MKMNRISFSVTIVLAVMLYPGLTAKAEVLLRVDFENRSIGSYTKENIEADWASQPGWQVTEVQHPEFLEIVDDSGSKVLRAKHPKGIAGGEGDAHFVSGWPEPLDEVYASFKIKWDSDFFFTYGGKMPRLVGGINDASGCGKPTRYFSTSLGWYRFNWKDQSKAMISPYVYHLDQPDDCGELEPVKDLQLKPGKWYTIEIHTKINTPGQKDGLMEIFVDGNKVFSRKNYRFRNDGSYAIERFAFKTHFGGSNTPKWQPVKDEYTFYDDFIISTEPRSLVDDGGTDAGSNFCHRIISESDMPQAAYFAPPYDLFSTGRDLLVQALCRGNEVKVTAGKTGSQMLVYNQGYVYREGSWQSYALTGNYHPQSSDWITGAATATIPAAGFDMSTNNFLLAYTCQAVNGGWKCGCRDAACTRGYWQLQLFRE